jgi:hypothetical protein
MFKSELNNACLCAIRLQLLTCSVHLAACVHSDQPSATHQNASKHTATFVKPTERIYFSVSSVLCCTATCFRAFPAAAPTAG